jgi:DNA-binding NtrC family response regulator
LPPLRKRREDIPNLIQKILVELQERYGQRVSGMSPEAIDLCTMYDWPGNLRQLKNAIEFASIMAQGKLILPRHLPDSIQAGISGEGNDRRGSGKGGT